MGTPVGIDLGTTNTAGAFVREGGAVELAPTPTGERLTPSQVYVRPGGEVIVGRLAERAGVLDPDRHFQFMKRDMGDPDWGRDLDGKRYTPVLLSSFVLKRALDDLTLATGARVRDAVVTVPAYFGDLERAATWDAARIAGLSKIRMINEPTAAALSYGFDPVTAGERVRAVVYDLGGGTFDVTIAEIAQGRVHVLATAGEHRLGGKDWDDELVNMAAEHVVEETGRDPREEPLVLAELRERCERAKHALSESERTAIQVALPDDGRSLRFAVTRDAFEARTRGLVEQTETQLEVALEKAGLRWEDVDAVMPVGGSTRMPMVRALLRRVSGREPLAILHPDEAVARGAAIYASLLARGGGHELELAVPVPEKRAPSQSGRLAPSFRDVAEPEEESQEELPLLPGTCRVPEVKDVVAHALGVLVVTRTGGKNAVLVPEQTQVPVERKRVFATIRRDQTAVCVKVLQGSDPDPDGCTLIGTLVVDKLPAGRPKGQRIEVTYRLDEDGRIQVAATDLATGKAARATIERQGAIAEEEIASLRREVEERVRS